MVFGFSSNRFRPFRVEVNQLVVCSMAVRKIMWQNRHQTCIVDRDTVTDIASKLKTGLNRSMWHLIPVLHTCNCKVLQNIEFTFKSSLSSRHLSITGSAMRSVDNIRIVCMTARSSQMHSLACNLLRMLATRQYRE
jgi:ribosome-associated toxin RatA of RatAB toxin-antitoxin module